MKFSIEAYYTEEDCWQVICLVNSNVQFLYLIFNAIVLCRFRWFLIRDLKKLGGSSDDGNRENNYSSFSFSALDHDHWLISTWNLHKILEQKKAKRSASKVNKVVKFCCLMFRLSIKPPKWAFRGVISEDDVSRWSARYIPACTFCIQ